MLYIAMFDEVDEATAIFKCSNNPPTAGGEQFLTLGGLPSNFYLRLAEQAGKLLRDEIPLSTKINDRGHSSSVSRHDRGHDRGHPSSVSHSLHSQAHSAADPPRSEGKQFSEEC